MKRNEFEFRWEGEGVKEIGKEKDSGIVRVMVNEKYFRPTEVVSCIARRYFPSAMKIIDGFSS